jgi:hypothetical protein
MFLESVYREENGQKRLNFLLLLLNSYAEFKLT